MEFVPDREQILAVTFKSDCKISEKVSWVVGRSMTALIGQRYAHGGDAAVTKNVQHGLSVTCCDRKSRFRSISFINKMSSLFIVLVLKANTVLGTFRKGIIFFSEESLRTSGYAHFL